MLLVRSTVPLRLLLLGFVGFWVNWICWANNTAPGQITPNGALVFRGEEMNGGGGGEKKKKSCVEIGRVSCVCLLNNSDLNCCELLTLTLRRHAPGWRFRR